MYFMNKTHGGNIWKIAKENGLQPEDIIDFSASINPLGLSPKAGKAIKDTVPLLRHYPEPGADTLRAELAFYHNLPEENIIVGNGSTEFIYLIPRVFKPKKALIVEPAFSEYRNSLKSSGCGIEDFLTSEDEDFAPDIERLCSAMGKGCNLVYLGNPANPTGVLLSRKDILKIAAECLGYGAMLIVDEAFVDFVEEKSVKNDAILFDNLIVLRSMTKFFGMAGLRLGYMVAHKEIIKRFKDVVPPWSVNTLAIVAGIESLKDAEYIKKTREWLQYERPFLAQGMNAIPLLKPYPSRANYMLVKILMDDITAKDMQKRLLKSSIFIRDCNSFTGFCNNFFRVAVKRRDENILLLDAINHIFIEAQS